MIHLMVEGKPVLTDSPPDWATHVIKANGPSGKEFYANHTNGEREWYVDGGRIFEFHPDGYSVVRSLK